MNTDEMKLITDLSEQLKTMSNAKDADAEAAIQQHVAILPEAVYKLVQLVLIQHIAIDQLKSKISVLETKPAPAPKGFLDDLKEKLFGTAPSSTPASSATYTPSAAPNSPQRPAETLSNNPALNSGSSFLRQAMTVGAGVAGGMMLGNAIGSLFQHNNTGSFTPPAENIENNYYSQNPSDNSSADAQNTNYDSNDETNYQDATDNSIDDSSFGDNSSDDSDWS
jgi:hypothetical protein